MTTLGFAVSQPPKDDNYDQWYALVKTTIEHVIQRYGVDEVRSWSFEVWNGASSTLLVGRTIVTQCCVHV